MTDYDNPEYLRLFAPAGSVSAEREVLVLERAFEKP